jgi:hypothetical protein
MPIKSKLHCKTHGVTLSEKSGRLHYKRGCDVWYVDAETGELTRPYGKKTQEGTKTPAEDLDQGGAGLEEHVKGFEEPTSEILFVYHKGGKVERLWDMFPEHQAIFRALVEGGYFKGTPAEFVDASARFMLAAAGYEAGPCIIPQDMKPAYEETARLIQEGELVVVWKEEIVGEDHHKVRKMTLEVAHKEDENHDGDNITQKGIRPGDNPDQLEQVSGRGGKEKEPSKAD